MLQMLPLFAACAAPRASSRAHHHCRPARPHPCQSLPPPAVRAHLCFHRPGSTPSGRAQCTQLDPGPPPLPLLKSSLACARTRPRQPEEPLAIQSSAVPLVDSHFERRCCDSCFCLRLALLVQSSVQIASVWGLTPHFQIPTRKSMWMQPRTVKGAAAPPDPLWPTLRAHEETLPSMRLLS